MLKVWEIPKYRPDSFTNDYGFITDYLSEFMRELRKDNYSNISEKYFKLGNNLNQRDAIAVRKLISGFIKLIYPDGEVSKDEVAEIMDISLELRRRVKEQLKKIGGMEFYDVNFSYIDNDSFDEHFVTVPEQGGGKMIPEGMGKPGCLYTVSKSKTGMIGCYRLETQMMPGNGKLTCTGIGSGKEPKEATNTAFNYLKANGNAISGSISTTTKDYIINYQDMQGLGMTGNPITEGRTGTLETYLPEVETYLQEKAQQEQTNNQLVTQGRENALEQQPEKEKMIEEKTLSELEKEPVVEPETVHITFTVAECGEFHTMGEFHEGIETIEEAMQLYNVIDPSRMHGIPSLGVNMHIDGTEEWEDEEADIVRGNCIDVDFLNYTPELRDTPTVQDALKKLIAAYPDKEVNDRETKEAKIQTIATELDQLSYDIDTFEYRDSVPDREAQVQMIANDIRSGNVKPLQIFLQTSIDEGIDADSERQAKELLAKLAEYKPLAKIEELEEQNYNMIDDRLNNGVEKFYREEEKKEQAEKPQARSSLKERLVAKQKEVAQGKKDSKEQEKSKNTHREM